MCTETPTFGHSLQQDLVKPVEVVRRVGEYTYRIKVGPGKFRGRELDICEKHVSLEDTAHEADLDNNYAELGNYTVEKLLAQRPNASKPGGVEFKVR